MRTRAWLLGGAAAAGAGVVLFGLETGPVPLARQRSRLPAGREDGYRRMTAFEPPVNVLERSGTHAIAEFPVAAGWYRTATRERVALDPARRWLRFEQLRSPFPGVRTATETFELADEPGGGTTVTLTGVLRPRRGLLAWALTRWLVRPYWDRIDADYMARVRRELAASGAVG